MQSAPKDQLCFVCGDAASIRYLSIAFCQKHADEGQTIIDDYETARRKLEAKLQDLTCGCFQRLRVIK